MLNFLFSFVLLFFLFGCSNEQSKDKILSLAKCPMIWIGFDGTGSFEAFEIAKADLLLSLSTLAPGARVVLRQIGSDSYHYKNGIFNYSLPNLKSDINPFSRKGKFQNKIIADSLVALKSKIAENLQLFRSQNFARTDIDGFLLYVQQNSDSSFENIIVLVSDLEQNVDKYSSLLSNTGVVASSVLVVGYPFKDPALRDFWNDRFISLGINSIHFFPPGEPVDFSSYSCK